MWLCRTVARVHKERAFIFKCKFNFEVLQHEQYHRWAGTIAFPLKQVERHGIGSSSVLRSKRTSEKHKLEKGLGDSGRRDSCSSAVQLSLYIWQVLLAKP
eukprot:803936-Amphidinium_carterae.1